MQPSLKDILIEILISIKAQEAMLSDLVEALAKEENSDKYL